MKIGILTFHFADNYGAALQCLSLYRTLQAMGHEVNVIDYRPAVTAPLPLWKGWGLRSSNPSVTIRQRYLEIQHRPKRKSIFKAFCQRHFTLSSHCSSLEETARVSRDYNALIVGSDQVWSHPFHKPPVYFLDLPGFGGRRISYAPCCGFRNSTQTAEIDPVLQALKNFDALSVRNQVTHDWVHQGSGLTPTIVADPTLLYDPPRNPAPAGENYIVAYVLDKEIPGGHGAALSEIKKIHGNHRVIGIVSERYAPAILPHCDQVIWEMDPLEFTNLIAGAAFVYTDSFHGAIYAMKSQRPLALYSSLATRAPRLRDLVCRYGLENALVQSVQEGIEHGSFRGEIDYASVDEKIKSHARSSIEFLQKALS